jgi:CheY-like chemotaxis protein
MEQRPRILIVDDEPLIGRALGRMLRSTYDVEVSPGAQDAIARLERGEAFDLILSDVMMPEMTGIDLFHHLERTRPADARRMIFFTGGSFTEESRVFLETVSNPCLQKPVDPDALRALIERCLRADPAAPRP